MLNLKYKRKKTTDNNYRIFFSEYNVTSTSVRLNIKNLYKLVKNIPDIDNIDGIDRSDAIAEILHLFNNQYMKKVTIGSYHHRRYEKVIVNTELNKNVIRTIANRYPPIKEKILSIFNYNAVVPKKSAEDLFFEDFESLVKDSGATIDRQYGLKYKDKQYRLDFLIRHGSRALNVEHDGSYHENRSYEDALRDKHVMAALLYDHIDGVKIIRVPANKIDEQNFLKYELPDLLKWLER